MTRDSRGRFTKGNPGGPGGPRRQVEEDYLETLTEAVSPDDWKAIVEKAVADAKRGDPRAREWLGKHLIGDRLSLDVEDDLSGLSETDLIALLEEELGVRFIGRKTEAAK